ncbi:MAG: trigger factor [Acidobacteriota bacterium]
MNVSVVDLGANQKKLQVAIPAGRVQEEIESKYRDLAKNVRIKGFRPGKVPRSILKSYYGQSIQSETSSQLIQESFPQALRDSNVKPLAEADVDDMRFEDDGGFTYSAIVEVCPPFELEGYKGLEIKRKAITISEEQVDQEIEKVRQRHAQLKTIEDENREIAEGDAAMVDFTPYIGEKVFERGRTTDFMVEVGMNSLHPDFDKNLIGHKAGDSFSFELDYPEDAPTSEIAGKRVRFDLTIKEIKEKELPELNDEFAQQVGQQFDTLDALKQSIREQIQKREENMQTSEIRRQITEQLLQKAQFEISAKVIDREVDRMVEMLQQQFQAQGLKIDASRFDTPEIRAEYRPQADANIRRGLVLQRIAELENVELTEEEMEAVYREVATYARVDVQKIKREYADSSIVEQTRESKLQDKVFQMLEQEAQYTEVSAEEEEKPSEQE